MRAYRESLLQRFGYRLDPLAHSSFPQAGAVARLGARALRAGQGVAAQSALPVYLRDKVAYTEAERGVASSSRHA
jgi:tRNA threonylcarbamoyladenosine biosynthesis protein TsaB